MRTRSARWIASLRLSRSRRRAAPRPRGRRAGSLAASARREAAGGLGRSVRRHTAAAASCAVLAIGRLHEADRCRPGESSSPRGPVSSQQAILAWRVAPRGQNRMGMHRLLVIVIARHRASNAGKVDARREGRRLAAAPQSCHDAVRCRNSSCCWSGCPRSPSWSSWRWSTASPGRASSAVSAR